MTAAIQRMQAWAASRRFDWLTVYITGLASVYCAAYLRIKYLPGNSEYPMGWWGWWDQSWYLKSAAAFAVGNLDPAQHWYPFGYSLLAAPFVRLIPAHAFFFVNLGSFLLMAALLVILSRRLGLGSWGGVAAFLIGVVLPAGLFEQYVVPWNTTPVSALYVAVFLTYADCVLRGVSPGRFALVGALAAVVIAIRPTDGLPLVPVAVHLLSVVARSWAAGTVSRWNAIRALGSGIVAFGSIVSAYALLHVSIYGFKSSAYMAVAAQLGLDPPSVPFRFFVIFGDPRPFFGEGVGILERYPTVAIGLFGLIYTSVFWRRFVGIPAAVWLTFGLYLAFVDFLPSGLWRYNNIHYFSWTFPFLALLTFVAVAQILREGRVARALVALVVAVPLVILGLSAGEQPVQSIQVVSGNEVHLASSGKRSIAAVRLEGIEGSQNAIYFGDHVIDVDGARLKHIRDFRIVSANQSVYLIFNHPLMAELLRISLAPDLSVGGSLTAVFLQPRVSVRNLFVRRSGIGAALPRGRQISGNATLGDCPGEVAKVGIAPAKDSDFIRLAYRAVLGRDPDPVGFASGCEALQRGLVSRKQFIEGLVASPEFRARTQ